jgi:hypothetical protein
MRKARITWAGAYHHLMNRGINDEYIFETPTLKELYLNLLEMESKKFNSGYLLIVLWETIFTSYWRILPGRCPIS